MQNETPEPEHKATPQEEYSGAGGEGKPPRRTGLAYGKSDDNFSFSQKRRLPIHPDQQDWLGTQLQLRQRTELKELLILAWQWRRNDKWKSNVEEAIAANRVNQDDLESLLKATEDMGPDEIESLFPNLPHLWLRLRQARTLVRIPEN